MDNNFQNLIPDTNFGEKNNSKIKKIILSLVLILIVVGMLVFAFVKKDWLVSLVKNEPKEEVLPPAPQYTKQEFSADKIPEVFPKDLIQEKDPIILENYSAEIEGKSVQYTLKYISKKSLDENLESYEKYFHNDKWMVLSKEKKENQFVLRVAKDKNSITFTQTYDKANVFSVVDIILVKIILKNQ